MSKQAHQGWDNVCMGRIKWGSTKRSLGGHQQQEHESQQHSNRHISKKSHCSGDGDVMINH